MQIHCNKDGAFSSLIIQLELFFLNTGIHTQESHTWQETGNDLRGTYGNFLARAQDPHNILQ